ncbi:MAG: DNA-binding protein [Coriobacteriia bacterium]|nr:DNA-binding protein [Coriobacteriia bacterium]
MMSVSEASALYGISGARIRKLIQEKRISAERQGKYWYVDEASLQAYLRHAVPGRPTKRERQVKDHFKPQEFAFMSRGHVVGRCVYDPLLKQFTQFELKDEARAPLALHSYEKSGLCKKFNDWWGLRAVPMSRSKMRHKLHTLGLESTFEAPLKSLGLSLSDQYWLCPEEAPVSWEDITFFRQQFELGEVKDDPLGRENPWLSAIGLNSPDNTTDGMLEKRWILDAGGRRLLVKGCGESGREAVGEVVATMLYRRLLPASRYVDYRLARWNGRTVSVCETFLRDDEEFIPAWYVKRLKKRANNHSAYRHYCELCQDLNVFDAQRQLDRMLVCDSILANTDRHWGNFGIVRNVETLELRAAPIFDTGTSLWSHLSVADMVAGDYAFTTKPFYEKPNRQLDLVIDASWYDARALEGFVDEVREFLTELLLADTATVICQGLAKRVETANFWARNAPTSAFSPEVLGDPETLDLVWL